MTNESRGKANELLQKLVAGIIARHEKGSRFGISAEEAYKIVEEIYKLIKEQEND